jgi:hypothetical protein
MKNFQLCIKEGVNEVEVEEKVEVEEDVEVEEVIGLVEAREVD